MDSCDRDNSNFDDEPGDEMGHDQIMDSDDDFPPSDSSLNDDGSSEEEDETDDLKESSFSYNREQINAETLFAFTVGSVYESPRSLLEQVKAFASSRGFVVIRDGSRISCNRGSKTRPKKAKCDPSKVRERVNWMKVECPYRILFRFVKRLSKQDRLQGKRQEEHFPHIKITSVIGMHGENCQPGHEQAILCRRRSGTLTQFEKESLKSLVNQINSTEHVPAPTLRTALAPFVPKNCALTPQNLGNFRIWAKKNATKFTKGGIDIQLSKSRLGRIIVGNERSLALFMPNNKKDDEENQEISNGTNSDSVTQEPQHDDNSVGSSKNDEICGHHDELGGSGQKAPVEGTYQQIMEVAREIARTAQETHTGAEVLNALINMQKVLDGTPPTSISRSRQDMPTNVTQGCMPCCSATTNVTQNQESQSVHHANRESCNDAAQVTPPDVPAVGKPPQKRMSSSSEPRPAKKGFGSGKSRTCGICRCEGHNRQTCPRNPSAGNLLNGVVTGVPIAGITPTR